MPSSVLNNSVSIKNRLRVIAGVILVLLGLVLLAITLKSYWISAIPGKFFSGLNQNAPKPTHIKISSIGVDAGMEELGLNADGTLAVPKDWNKIGWYTGSPAPGAIGPSILVGHLDSFTGKAVFWNLKDMKVGDLIKVDREDGSSVTFAVIGQQSFSQNDFPSDQVYGPTNYPALRLITCTGTYSRLAGRYSDNLVVYAALIK